MVQIAILGTGMIGTSIGLALKDNPDVTIEKIVGYDRDKSNMRAAKKVGAVDDTEGNLHKALKDASIMFGDTPIVNQFFPFESVLSIETLVIASVPVFKILTL